MATQHKGLTCDNQNSNIAIILSVILLILCIGMLNVISVSVIMLTVVMLNVIMLSVVAPANYNNTGKKVLQNLSTEV
jgi:hypothetical protein